MTDHLPLGLARLIFRLPLARRPEFFAVEVADFPDEVPRDVVMLEVRAGYPKWIHLRCPKCGERVQLPMAGKPAWSAKVDLLCRPSLAPSVWERASCGAHFWVRKGRTVWCGDSPE